MAEHRDQIERESVIQFQRLVYSWWPWKWRFREHVRLAMTQKRRGPWGVAGGSMSSRSARTRPAPAASGSTAAHPARPPRCVKRGSRSIFDRSARERDGPATGGGRRSAGGGREDSGRAPSRSRAAASRRRGLHRVRVLHRRHFRPAAPAPADAGRAAPRRGVDTRAGVSPARRSADAHPALPQGRASFGGVHVPGAVGGAPAPARSRPSRPAGGRLRRVLTARERERRGLLVRRGRCPGARSIRGRNPAATHPCAVLQAVPRSCAVTSVVLPLRGSVRCREATTHPCTRCGSLRSAGCLAAPNGASGGRARRSAAHSSVGRFG